MNLPIIRSILFDVLYPNVAPIVRNVNGKPITVPADYSANDYNGAPDDYSMMIIKYDSYEEDPEDFVSFPSVRTRYLLNYPALSRAFSTLPTTLSDLEQLCVKNLSPYVVFDFENERPVSISEVAPSEYTPIPSTHYPVDFQLITFTPQYPFAKFYMNVIHVEMERVKLALLDYAQISQSDILSKVEIENTLTLMRNYAAAAKESQEDYIYSSRLAKIHNVSKAESSYSYYEFNIFPLLQLYLIKTYLEIEILFQPILKKNIEQDFDELMYDCFKQYPDSSCESRLQATMLIHDAQHLIEENDINALESLHPEFVRLYPFNTNNAAFMEVFKAVENAIFLGDNTDIRQLIDDKYCKVKFREKRKALEQKINAKGNPRQIQFLLEDELDEFDLYTDSDTKLQSIPRMLLSWVNKQLEVNEHHLGSSFVPVTEIPPQNPSEEKELPSTEEFAVSILEEKYETFVSVVKKYRFVQLEKIKGLNASQQSRLIHLIVQKPASYAVAMLKFLGYFELLQTEYELNNLEAIQHVTKALSKKDIRTISGNYYVLQQGSGEDPGKYGAASYVKEVEDDYNNIVS